MKVYRQFAQKLYQDFYQLSNNMDQIKMQEFNIKRYSICFLIILKNAQMIFVEI